MCDKYYRGISLTDYLAKMFDSIFECKMELWFQPGCERAESQNGQGCLEHLLTLRLWMDFAKHKKRQLLIVFVDFPETCNWVPQFMLVQHLISYGCGATVSQVITTIDQNTEMILHTAVVTSSNGVMLGSASPCLLFTVTVNYLIQNLKHRCLPR